MIILVDTHLRADVDDADYLDTVYPQEATKLHTAHS